MSEKMTKAEMVEILEQLEGENIPAADICDALRQALEHVPEDLIGRIPHWVHVRNYPHIAWDRRILVMDQADGSTYRYRCAEGTHSNRYIAGADYATSDWRYMEEIPKRVPWTAQDYAEKQIVYLRWKGGELWRMTDFTLFVADSPVYWVTVTRLHDDTTEKHTYERLAGLFTLPDGTELYKDGVE